ncbi:MAG: hypothetical protein Phog2KO_22240 [Phototrophicaceae bacterium]
MSTIMILKLGAAIANILFGIVALAFPKRVAEAAFLKADSTEGQAEIRASWGGLFIGLGVAVIFLGSDDAYFVFGIAYAITALVRAITWSLDRSIINRTAMIIMAFEVISAVIFAIPSGQI